MGFDVVFVVFVIIWVLLLVAIFCVELHTRRTLTDLPTRPTLRNLPPLPSTYHELLQLSRNLQLNRQTIHQNLQPQQDIESGQIKVFMFKDIKYNEEEEGTDKRSCPICLEEYQDDHEIRRLNNCGHIFHPFCIYSWLKVNRSCPICRSPV